MNNYTEIPQKELPIKYMLVFNELIVNKQKQWYFLNNRPKKQQSISQKKKTMNNHTYIPIKNSSIKWINYQ